MSEPLVWNLQSSQGSGVETGSILLIAHHAVGATADDESMRLGSSHHFHGDLAGRVTDFQRAIYVEADQEHRHGDPPPR